MIFEKPWGNYLLEAIVETKAPDNISFWPQTIAWQLLLVLLIMIVIKKSYQSWRNYQANAYRREALAWLSQCSLANEEDVRQLPALLRKTAILANKRLLKENRVFPINSGQGINNLSGSSWTKWLDEHCSKSHFSAQEEPCSPATYSAEKLLAQLAYMPEIDLNNAAFKKGLIQLIQQIELWITHHDLFPKLSTASEEAPSGETT